MNENKNKKQNDIIILTQHIYIKKTKMKLKVLQPRIREPAGSL
jgi:hypothetical protein